jgi:hypothetical protein
MGGEDVGFTHITLNPMVNNVPVIQTNSATGIGKLHFKIHSGNSTMVLTGNDGQEKVGIGTTEPTAKLDVNGTAKFNGNVTVNAGNLLIGTSTNNGVDRLQVNGSISANNHFDDRATFSLGNNSTVWTRFFNTRYMITGLKLEFISGHNSSVYEGSFLMSTYCWENNPFPDGGEEILFTGNGNIGTIEIKRIRVGSSFNLYARPLDNYDTVVHFRSLFYSGHWVR